MVVEEDDEKSEDSSIKKSKETLSAETHAQGELSDDEVFSSANQKVCNAPILSSPPAELSAPDHSDDKLVAASIQTAVSIGSESNCDDDLWNIRRDVLYQFIPLPPSTTTTPSASVCNLENY